MDKKLKWITLGSATFVVLIGAGTTALTLMGKSTVKTDSPPSTHSSTQTTVRNTNGTTTSVLPNFHVNSGVSQSDNQLVEQIFSGAYKAVDTPKNIHDPLSRYISKSNITWMGIGFTSNSNHEDLEIDLKIPPANQLSPMQFGYFIRNVMDYIQLELLYEQSALDSSGVFQDIVIVVKTTSGSGIAIQSNVQPDGRECFYEITKSGIVAPRYFTLNGGQIRQYDTEEVLNGQKNIWLQVYSYLYPALGSLLLHSQQVQTPSNTVQSTQPSNTESSQNGPRSQSSTQDSHTSNSSSSNPNSSPKMVQVPDLTGLTESQASAKLSALGLSVGSTQTRQSFTYRTGTVISQDPSAGAQVAVGQSVFLAIAQQVTPIEVMNVAPAFVSGAGYPTGASGSEMYGNKSLIIVVGAGGANAGGDQMGLTISGGSGTIQVFSSSGSPLSPNANGQYVFHNSIYVTDTKSETLTYTIADVSKPNSLPVRVHGQFVSPSQ